MGFLQCVHEKAVYKKVSNGEFIIIAVYGDDIFVTGTSLDCINEFKRRMTSQFEMSDLEAGMEDCNATLYPMEKDLKLSKVEDEPEVEATQYRKVVGCLRYLLHTRPDLTYSVGVVSRYMQSPRESHARAIKQILRYLKGYSDSSHNVDIDDGRSTTGHVFYLGTSPITWCSQKQTTVTLSSCEAEFMAATAAACQAIWLRELLAEVTGLERQKSKKQVTPNPPEGGSKATSEGDWIKVQKKGSFQAPGCSLVEHNPYDIELEHSGILWELPSRWISLITYL
ncbi:uncharacterized mitochondrial protein-like protein [Tanacetum coccineum]